MPRTKQQRPRHILDENKNGESENANEMTLDDSSMSIEASPDGEYTTDSGISDGCSQRPSSEVSDCQISVKSDYNCGTTQREDKAESNILRRHSANSTTGCKMNSQPVDSLDEKINAAIQRPFVNPKYDSADKADIADGSEVKNTSYMDVLRSVIAHNMMDNETKSEQYGVGPNTGTDTHFFGQSHDNERFKNGMLNANPFQLLTKLFQQSIKTNNENVKSHDNRDVGEALRKNGDTKQNLKDNSFLKMAGTQPENRRAEQINHVSLYNPTENCRILSAPSTKLPKDESAIGFRPFLSEQSQRAKSSSPSESNKIFEASKYETRYPQIPWPVAAKPPLKKSSSTNEELSTRSLNKANNTSKTDSPPSFADREAVNTPERRRRSPYETKAAYQTPPLYNARRRNGSNLRDHDSLLTMYPYPPAGSHPFTLPLTGMGDFPTVPRHPYYNPWSFMYPTYHHAIPGLAPNPFMQQYTNDQLIVGGNPLPKSPSNLSPRVTPPNSDRTTPKKTSSRSKNQSTNPMDSLHAAIVREAKEMNKGMDPENMYIECPICHKRIKRLYHFQRHMRIHSGEKSHTCPFCPYKSVRKDNLKSHMKTHEKSKYDASRRVQTRRDSQSGANYSLKTDIVLPTESSQRRLSSASPVIETHPLCKTSPPVTGIPNLSYLPHQKTLFNQASAKEGISNHHSIDFSLITTPRYYPDTRFPYGSYPAVPPLVHFPHPSQRQMRESQACITEISDENSASPKSRKSSFDGNNVSDRCTIKRHSTSPTEAEPKRKKSSDSGQDITSGNTNNNNNMNLPHVRIFPDKDETKNDAVPQKCGTPDASDDPLTCQVKNPLHLQENQTRNRATSQNGESGKLNQMKPSNAENEDLAISATESEGLIEGTFISFVDTRQLKTDQNISPRRISSSSLDSATSNKHDATEEVKKSSDLIKTDLANSNSWNGLSRESKCRLCDFMASSNSVLQEHMSTHKEDGQYKCTQCEYHGKNLSKLIEHIRIHTGERPFQCDQCSYAAKRKDNLAQHKSVKHDKSRNKGPTRVLKLSTHEKTDSAEKTLQPVTNHSDYASILFGRSSLGPQEWPYVKNPKNDERFSCFPGDWYSKLRNLPFNGHVPFSGVISAKNALTFRPNFLSLSPSSQHPPRNSISSTTTR